MSAFSIFKDKRKQNKQQTPTAQAYYTRLANRAKIGMFSVIIALIIFCLLAYSFFPDELTAENFKYLLNPDAVDHAVFGVRNRNFSRKRRDDQ